MNLYNRDLTALDDAAFTQLVNAAFKNYHSVLTLGRSPLAHSPLVTPALVLDNDSPTVDERGHALRRVLQWAVERLAPGGIKYPPGDYRPFDDPTWSDPRWWHYNILRHRYLDPLHPDDFVEGGRFTETLLSLTGIPSPDTFFDERNRAIKEVAQRLQRLLTFDSNNLLGVNDSTANDDADHAAAAKLQQLALDEVYRPLQTPANANALAIFGIAATFGDVFPRALLIQMALTEKLGADGKLGNQPLDVDTIENILDELIGSRLLLTGDNGRNLWLSPVLQQYVYVRQDSHQLRIRHQQIAEYYAQQYDNLNAARHLQKAQQWSAAATTLLAAANDLMNELQVEELRATLVNFQQTHLNPDEWRRVQVLLSDLYASEGKQEEAVAACRQALQAAISAEQQAHIYRRMGKLYENHNPMHALTYYRQAKERFSVGDPELLIMLKDRAWVYIFQQEWKKADDDLRLALSQTSSAPKFREQRADIYDALSSLNRRQKSYEASIDYAQQALALREEIGNPMRVAASFNNLALIYRAMKAYPNAIHAFYDAMRIYAQINNQEHIATVWLNIGVTHYFQEVFQEAADAYTKSLAICKGIAAPLIEVKALSNLAECWAEMGDGETARRHWAAGYALSKEKGFSEQIAYYEQLRKTMPLLQSASVYQPQSYSMAEASSPVTSETQADVQSPYASLLAKLPNHLLSQLTPDEQAVLSLAAQEGRITPKTIMDTLDVSKATATRRLAALAKTNHLAKHGKGRGTYYVLADELTTTASQAPSTESIHQANGHHHIVYQQKLGSIWQTQQTTLLDTFGVSALGLLNGDNQPHGETSVHMVRVVAQFNTMPNLLDFFELERTLQGWFENGLDLLPVETVSRDTTEIVWL
ncbi:MAG: tetratricopeptide repeat protein [Chloroflexota bacterium]